MSQHPTLSLGSFLGHGVPSNPLEGDMWFQGDMMYVCVGGVPVVLAGSSPEPDNLPSEDMLKAVCDGD